MKVKREIKKILHKLVYPEWNIAIATILNDLSVSDVKWMKHPYKDRWFADPFIIADNAETFIILVEEYLYSTSRGRLARLVVSKTDCTLLRNDTILDLSTHLSFPNPINVEGKLIIYPENGAAGCTKYYICGEKLQQVGILSNEPLADATIVPIDGEYLMLATVGKECNGNKLQVYKSKEALGPYTGFQEIKFSDNTARRAGNVFEWNGRTISPAQICNNDYGEGLSFQELILVDGEVKLNEIKRMAPPTKQYPSGFHTYNVYKDNVVVIDGYRYGSELLHNLYFRIRK